MGRLLPYFLGRLPFSMEALPDLQSLSDAELRDLIRELMDEERQVSYQRRILHGKIDILRAELQARLKQQVGEGKSPSPRSTSTSSQRFSRRRRRLPSRKRRDARPLPGVRLSKS